MNFQQLEYVLAVHEHKHFGQASDSCHITQATLSAMIKKLEDELEIILFDRSKMPVKTTDIGLKFIDLAEEVLSQRQKMFHLKNDILDSLSGNITIGVIPTVANSLLPSVLPQLFKENPDLHLKIIEITTEDIIQQLKLDKIDMGILATPLEDEILEETILYYEAMMVYGVKGSNKKYISSDEIKNQKVWLLEEGNCFREQSMTICNIKEKEMESTNLNFEGSSFETLLNLTDQFGGYTLIPELYYHQMAKERKLKTMPFKPPIPVREISLVAHRPYAKLRTINYLADKIKKLIEGHLSTTNYKARDLEIIGI